MPKLNNEKKIIPPKKSIRFKFTVFFLCFISILAAMDAVIVGSCLSAISESFMTSSLQAFWVGTSFLLAQTVTIPMYGTTSEIFGRKGAILTGISLFLLGSILCSVATNVNFLIAARVVQGIGSGGITQLVQVIISDITTMEERSLYIGMTSAAWALGSNLGIPLGGVIGTYTSWRWVFRINIPICAICLVGLYWSLSLKTEIESFRVKLARVDFLGLCLFTSATTLFLYGITSGGVSAPWGSASVLAPTAVGVLLYVIFTLVQWKVAKEPMMPLQIFNDRSAITGYTSSFFHGIVIWCFIYYFIIFFLGAKQHSLVRSSLEVMSVSAWIAPGAIIGAIVIKKTLKFKYVIIAGWIMLCVGVATTPMTMHVDSSKAVLFGPRLISGIGGGLVMPTPLFAVQANQPDNLVGVATSMQIFFRSLGMTFGVAIGGVVFQNRWAALLPSRNLPPQVQITSDLAEVGYNFIVRFPEQVQIVYRQLYSECLDGVWWTMLGFCGAGFLCALLARNDKLRKVGHGTRAFDDGAIVAGIDLETGVEMDDPVFRGITYV